MAWCLAHRQGDLGDTTLMLERQDPPKSDAVVLPLRQSHGHRVVPMSYGAHPHRLEPSSLPPRPAQSLLGTEERAVTFVGG